MIKQIKAMFGKINFSAQGIILAIVLSSAFFLLGAQKFKTYQSQMTILVIPKSANAINQQDKILNNLLELPKTLSFYDRLLKNNPSFVDSSAGKSSLERKRSWDDMIVVKQVNKNGSMISISVSINNETDSDFIVSKTVRTLLDVASSYYNIKDDLDLRIVDGPITKVVFVGWPWILLVSILLGSLISLALGRISALGKKAADFQDMLRNNPLRKLNRTQENEQPMSIKDLENLYTAEKQSDVAFKDQPVQLEETEAQTEQEPEQAEVEPVAEVVHVQEIASRSVYPNFPEMPTQSVSRSAAPDNLPIADFGEVTNLPAQEVVKNEIPKEAQPAKEKTHEPTEDELRERLNQLLKGEI